MQEAKFSANFKKYKGETDYLFTVRSDETPTQHLESVIQYAEACDAHGFRDKPGANGKAGLAEGEESWPVDGYVVGPAKNRDGSTSFVLWMYGRGRFKTASIYSEKWDRLWFVPETNKVWPTNQAPEAEAARTSGFFVSVPEKEIVLQSYTNREGQNRRAFDRVLGASTNGSAKPPAAEPQIAPVASSEAAKLADTIINGVQTGATDPNLLVKFGERAMLRRPEVGTEWTRVQNVFRSKLTPMRYQFPRESMLDAIERLRQVIGEVHYKDLISSFQEPDDVPF